jgi:acyl carrier protein
MIMTTIETLNQIFCMVFDDDAIRIRPEMTANDIDGWDSLSHVNLITTIEAKFNIRFTHKELLKQRNIGDLITGVEIKLAA